MKKFFLIGFLCWAASAWSQENILRQIEDNNTRLQALRSQVEADEIANKTGIYLGNPEIEYGYLWGNHPAMGNRTDFSISQSFDFPTAYRHRKQLTDTQNSQVELKYRIERAALLLDVKKVSIQFIYQHALSSELKKQWELSRQIADAYSKKYQAGEVSILDLNKAKYELLKTQNTYKASLVEKEFLLSELQRFNGGKPLDDIDTLFSKVILPVDFKDWYDSQNNKNLSLLFLQKEVSIDKANEKLQRSLNLPKFSAGYMSEKVVDEHFQGITVGVSIPLWENKNTVKQIQAQVLAHEQMMQDASLQNYNQQESLYKKAVELQKMGEDLDTIQLTSQTITLLRKALDAGELSLIDFILELRIYYESIQSRLEIERDLQLTVADLFLWDL